MVIKAFAKLNLALDVVGKRPDGYHDMNMVMQSVSLHDVVTLEWKAGGISLECDDAAVPRDERNLAWKAAERFFSFTGKKGDISIQIEKHIPSQAGMAGGSADAAAVLAGLNQLYETGLSAETLCGLGKELGADVPFCLIGGTAHVTGIGERITPLIPLPDCSFAIVKPERGISTKEAFAALDRKVDLVHPALEPILKGIQTGDVDAICSGVGNAFEQVTELPEVFAAKCELLRLGARAALMSGSGSAVFGLFESEVASRLAQNAFDGNNAGIFQAVPVKTGLQMN